MDIEKFEQVGEAVQGAASEWGVEVNLSPVPDVGENVPYGVVEYDGKRAPHPMYAVTVMNQLALYGMRAISVDRGNIYFEDTSWWHEPEDASVSGGDNSHQMR